MQEEFKFHLHGCEIYGHHISPETARAVVVLVHGFGEHSGRYQDNVIPMLLAANVAVITYDNIGHGKSSGKRGHCPSYDSLLNILDTVIEKAKKLFPDLPVFLYGHSMGGNLVLNYSMRRTVWFAGIVATSPYLRLAFQPPKWKMTLGKLMLKIMPSIILPSGLEAKGISRIQSEVEKYRNDSLVFDTISPMYSFPVMDAGEWAIKNAGILNSNTLLLHGTGDQIIDYKATKEFHQKANRTTLKLFEGGYHELHHDLCKEEMLTVIKEWLNHQIESI